MAKNDDIIKRKPKESDWSKARTLCINGASYSEICKAMPTVDFTVQKISRKFHKEKMMEKKKAMEERVLDSVIFQTEEARKQVNKDCIELFNKGAKVINSLLNNCSEELATGQYTQGKARATAYNVDMLMSGVTKIQKGLRVAYGMDESGKLYEKEPEVLTIEGVSTNNI